MFNIQIVLTWHKNDEGHHETYYVVQNEVSTEKYKLSVRLIDGTLPDNWSVTLYRMRARQDTKEKPHIHRIPSIMPLKVFGFARHCVLDFARNVNPNGITMGLIPDVKLQRMYKTAIPRYLQPAMMLCGYDLYTHGEIFQFIKKV